MIARRALEVTEDSGSDYPSPFDELCKLSSSRNLGDAFSLRDFGIHLLTLPPGAWSSQRHWHSHEDEFIYVLEGTPTLITNEGETALEPGDVAGFPAGSTNGHHVVNNTDVAVQLLVAGSRNIEDDCIYSDIDMQILKWAQGGTYTKKNGDPY